MERFNTFQCLEDYLKQHGCKSIFLAGKEASVSGKDLDIKMIHYLCDKLVNFMDFRQAEGLETDTQQLADSLIRLFPCIKMVMTIFVNSHCL